LLSSALALLRAGWWPAAMPVSARERWRVALGAATALALLAAGWAWTDQASWWSGHHPGLVAPLGASALLVFAVPGSPMAQPWPVLAGNMVSALVGGLVAQWVTPFPAAVFLAVLLAILLMFALRCLHPPGAAMALLVVLTRAESDALAMGVSVLMGSLCVVVMAILYNRLTGRDYPASATAAPVGELVQAPRFSDRDLDEVLGEYNQVLDVGRGELEALLAKAQTRAYEKRLGTLRCGEVMTPQPIVVMFNQGQEAAWALLQQHQIKALPVVDRHGQLVGIVTRSDFFKQDRAIASSAAPAPEAPRLLQLTSAPVGDIMTRRVRVVREQTVLVDLVPLFSQYGHHHLPVVDANNHLVGILTESDMVRALFHAVKPAEQAG
jgi:CBS domain-containing membrane protein